MSKRDDLVSFRWEFRGGGRRRRMESLDIVRRRYRRVSVNFELIFGNWQDFLCLREGVQRDLHGGKRINFFFFFSTKGRAVWKPDVIRYSVVIAFDAYLSLLRREKKSATFRVDLGKNMIRRKQVSVKF